MVRRIMVLKRRDVPEVIARIQRRTPQTLDTFICDCGLAPSDRVRRIADTARKSLTVAGAFQDDQIRAEDAYPGTLEVLPGWDSLDFVEWQMEFEELLGQAVPDEAFEGLTGSFTVADLVKAVNNSKQVLPDARPHSA